MILRIIHRTMLALVIWSIMIGPPETHKFGRYGFLFRSNLALLFVFLCLVWTGHYLRDNALRIIVPKVFHRHLRHGRFVFDLFTAMGSATLSQTDVAMGETIRIVGIDPGLRRTGWGIVESCGSRLSFVAAGTVHSDAGGTLASRLCQLHEGLAGVVDHYRPLEAAVEQTFVNRDAAATLKLGQARGIAMLVPAQSGLSVAEYAPNAVKKSVIGVGHGDKKQIAMMVRVLLPRATWDSEDAADALAIAICHANQRGTAVMARRVAQAAG